MEICVDVLLANICSTFKYALGIFKLVKIIIYQHPNYISEYRFNF